MIDSMSDGRLFTMRVSDEWLLELRRVCNKKARTATAHIKRCLEVARLVDEILCNGCDEFGFVEKKLKAASERLQKRKKKGLNRGTRKGRGTGWS